MLVLSRKSGQSLVIGGSIVVTILDVEGERVKVGVEAAREVSVLRGELHAAAREENLLAGAAGAAVGQLPIPLLCKPERRKE